METLQLVAGTSRDFGRQIVDATGAPLLNLFTGNETLATSVWRGDGTLPLFTPTTTWISGALGTFQIAINNTDTATLPRDMYRIQSTATTAGRTLVVFDGRLQITSSPSTTAPTDLITQDYFENCAAIRGLSDIEEQAVPQLLSAASRLIRKHCNRWFNRRPSSIGPLTAYDGLYTLDWPSRTLVLRQFPVNGILRARTSPTQVFNVTNTSSSNQQAWVSLAYSGVADISDIAPTTTGMTFSTISSGVLTTTTLLLTGSNATFQGLATSIAGLGNGWSAQVIDPKYGAWPTADLRQGIGPSCAVGTYAQQGFWVHVDDMPVQVDQEAGIVQIDAGNFDPWTSPRYGLYLDTGLGDLDIGGGLNGIRIMYDAGWDTVPEDVQQACAETVADMLNTIKIDQRRQAEDDGSYSYQLSRLERYALPPSVLGKLGYYRNIRS